MKKLSSQKGFSAIEALLLVVLVVLIAGVGYYVYSQRQTTDSKSTSPQASSQKVSLNKGTVSLQLPNDWYATEHSQEHQQCKDGNEHIYEGLCTDDIYLIPNEKPHADSYAVGPTEDEEELNNPYRYFNINVMVLKNEDGSKTAQEWYKRLRSKNAMDKPGKPAKPTSTSTDTNNGQSIYSEVYEIDDTISGQQYTSKDVTYVVLKGDKVVMVSSYPKQTRETVGDKEDGSDNTYEALDFTRFEPTIQSVVYSVRIK